MFGALTKKLQTLFSKGGQVLTEGQLSDAVREVRQALLDADVHFTVAEGFVERVKGKVLGTARIKGASQGDQFIKCIHDELVALMGSEEAPLDLQGKCSVVMLCGLQGSGKTTTAAKLAAFVKKQEPHRKVLLAACDLQRPAAVEQLKTLAQSVGVELFAINGETRPVEVARQAREKAQREGYGVLIVDTAGRLHVDEALMQELSAMKEALQPREVLFVASAATGQDAVRTAVEFDRRVSLTGAILTMLDGSARAGAALSIREVVGKPLKFEGVGEKVGDLQVFNPRSMADRILGMGDVVNLVKKAQEHMDEASQAEMEKKLRKASFTYDDYLKQMGMIRKMGSIKSLLKMLPGFSALEGLEINDKEFGRLEAMILSMTPAERQERVELDHSRKKRIAKGSGVDLDAVNAMVKRFKKVKQLLKEMPSFGKMDDLKKKMRL
jgi:signal recognition particle subunit SRP54